MKQGQVQKGNTTGKNTADAIMEIISKSQKDFKTYETIFEKIFTLEQLSGYSIDTLISLFAAGFKLTAPPPGQKLGDLL